MDQIHATDNKVKKNSHYILNKPGQKYFLIYLLNLICYQIQVVSTKYICPMNLQ